MRGRKKKNRETKNYYHISRVSQMFNLHPQTLRLYEREGLLTPSRSQGNTRLYTDEDLKRLELILNLIRELGVNLAGVEVILNMRERMLQMEDEVKELLEYVKKEFFSGHEDEFESRRKSLVKLSHMEMVKIEEPGEQTEQ
ncbi:MAG: MerR family transcriptional regulator [Acidobacteriota bacterium]